MNMGIVNFVSNQLMITPKSNQKTNGNVVDFNFADFLENVLPTLTEEQTEGIDKEQLVSPEILQYLTQFQHFIQNNTLTAAELRTELKQTTVPNEMLAGLKQFVEVIEQQANINVDPMTPTESTNWQEIKDLPVGKQIIIPNKMLPNEMLVELKQFVEVLEQQANIDEESMTSTKGANWQEIKDLPVGKQIIIPNKMLPNEMLVELKQLVNVLEQRANINEDLMTPSEKTKFQEMKDSPMGKQIIVPIEMLAELKQFVNVLEQQANSKVDLMTPTESKFTVSLGTPDVFLTNEAVGTEYGKLIAKQFNNSIGTDDTSTTKQADEILEANIQQIKHVLVRQDLELQTDQSPVVQKSDMLDGNQTIEIADQSFQFEFGQVIKPLTFRESIANSVIVPSKQQSETPQQDMNAELEQLIIKHTKLPNGVSEAKMQLHPHELGQVDVKLTTHQGSVTAQLIAETAAAKELIEGQIQQLKHSLVQQGFQVEKIEVQYVPAAASSSSNLQDMRGGFQFSGQQQFSQQNQSSRQYSRSKQNLVSHYGYSEENEEFVGVPDHVSGINYTA